MRPLLAAPLAALLLALLAACAAPRPAPLADVITVEGLVAAQGAEPDAAYVLTTDDRNRYVLALDADRTERFRTPARYRVTGRLYGATWQGRTVAHLAVDRLEPVE